MNTLRMHAVAGCLLSLAVLVAGCSGAAPGDPGVSGTASEDSPSSSRTPEVLVADPEHAVDPPPKFSGVAAPADMLVYDQHPLSDALVNRIKKAKGVESVVRISLAQASIQNELIMVAAVDPATYRNFTPSNAAKLQEIWDRVAGGEVAILPELKQKLEDEQGYVRLGNDADAPRVHVGAYAPQAEQIDAVVNEEWGKELGMRLGNALLITTGIHSPAAVRKPVEKIVGKRASVQNLDVVARLGLDIDAVQTAFLTGGSVAAAVGTFNYRVLAGGKIAPDPAWVAANIRTEVVPILGSVTCHKVIFPQLRAALSEIQATPGLAGKIHPDEYAGCYYPRFIANTNKLSLHAFGIALDLNVPGNQRGTVGEIDRRVVAIFERWGFTWGGRWSWTDPMHFEMNALVDPR
jgi:hypothetical protein